MNTNFGSGSDVLSSDVAALAESLSIPPFWSMSTRGVLSPRIAEIAKGFWVPPSWSKCICTRSSPRIKADLACGGIAVLRLSTGNASAARNKQKRVEKTHMVYE
jgi:hypothetical protein